MHDAPILPESFYERDTVQLAHALLGKLLVAGGQAGRINEVEAYLGREDLAAHSSRGLTKRTAVIFGPPGRAYVYLIYGLHCCLNIVAERDGVAGCVLIRGIEGVDGPGRLTRHFGITRAHNGVSVFDAASPVTIHDIGYLPPRVKTTPRIGISQCKDWPLRFVAG